MKRFKKPLGLFLVSLPFLAIFAGMALDEGLMITVFAFMAVAIVAGAVIVGTLLLTGEL